MTDDVTDDSTTETDGQQHDETEPKPDHREAAYRRRATEAEAARDALQVRLDARDRTDAIRLAELFGLAQGSDLLDIGAVPLENLRDKVTGEISTESVKLLTAELLAGRPGLASKVYDADQGKRGVGSPRSKASSSWADLLQGGQAG